MGAKRMRALFDHTFADTRELVAVPDVGNRIVIDVAQDSIVVAAHRDIAIRVIYLEVRPRVFAYEFFQFSVLCPGKRNG